MAQNIDYAILIHKLPERLISEAVKFLEESISIPSSALKSKKMVEWGLSVYFDSNPPFYRAVLSGAADICGRIYEIYPLVTNLTVHGAGAHMSENSLKILLTRLGQVLCVYRERRWGAKELTDNYRVVINYPEIHEKIKSWPASSVKLPNSDVVFPITFFCRICRRNGHTRRQCTKTQFQSTPTSTNKQEDRTKPSLHCTYSPEYESCSNRTRFGIPCETGSVKEEMKVDISDAPLDLTLKSPERSGTQCLNKIRTAISEDAEGKSKLSVKKRKSFSYKSLIPPSLQRGKGEHFMKFCLGLVRTPNAYEVAKKYTEGIENLLEQLSSFVRFNINLMETRSAAEKRFIISIDSLISKLRFIMREEIVSQTRSTMKNEPKPFESDSEVKDFSWKSAGAIGKSTEEAKSVMTDIHPIVQQNLDGVISNTDETLQRNAVIVAKMEQMRKRARCNSSSTSRSNERNDSGKIKTSKNASIQTAEKTKQGNKTDSERKNNNDILSKESLPSTESKLNGVSFAEIHRNLSKNLSKETQTEFLSSKKNKRTVLSKNRKKLEVVRTPKNSCNLKVNKKATVVNSTEDCVKQVQNLTGVNADRDNTLNSTKLKDGISVVRPSLLKPNDDFTFAKQFHNVVSQSLQKNLFENDFRVRTEIKEKREDYLQPLFVIKKTGGIQHKIFATKKKDNKSNHDGTGCSLHISSDRTFQTQSEPKNTVSKPSGANGHKKFKSIPNISPSLNRIISSSEGVLTHIKLKAFLAHVRNRRHPRKLAEKYSTEVDQIINQLRTIAPKYYLGLKRNRADDKEIEWIDSLIKRLEKHETCQACNSGKKYQSLN